MEAYFTVHNSCNLLTVPDQIPWVAGSNQAGQLGVGGTADVQQPQVLQVCKNTGMAAVDFTHAVSVYTCVTPAGFPPAVEE